MHLRLSITSSYPCQCVGMALHAECVSGMCAAAMGLCVHAEGVCGPVQHAGQVYIPLMNYLLALLCLIITGTFQTSDNIGKAYGRGPPQHTPYRYQATT